MLKVMAGDQVQIRAESYYTLPGGGVGSPLNLAATDLIAAFAGSPGFPGSKGASATDIGNIAGNTTAIGSFLTGNSNGTNAKAFLCWALFDEREMTGRRSLSARLKIAGDFSLRSAFGFTSLEMTLAVKS